MTKRSYVIIAKALADTRPGEAVTIHRAGGPAGLPDVDFTLRYAQWRLTRNVIATSLQADNPRFDRAIFIRATEA